ncbi:GNAT family N-acetyltransferase [Rossellomorea vietnamensis]|uniref:GNAT family N-acetyltransferase n=1 Tax=Rossellomorea vietnamensis TaxID=218284 RepID=A0A5D4MI52_9BACI|nr:GNAT family N-acetyltransferase [Rossellomorea vietnamensis]TYS01257.1 GNAT family N-acetyltransferase [Rossellomorea vietnamensis]
MLNSEIRRPSGRDIKELHHFFKTVITDVFNKEGIADKVKDMEDEIESKKAYLQSDLESNGEHRFFLIAVDGDRIIGSIEYGAASELIRILTDGALKDLNEVGTVFVHPDYRGNGIANLLLNKMYSTLHLKGIEDFCLDSGYVSSQSIWKKKFGEQHYFFQDYWGEGNHHMIWRLEVGDLFK